MDRYTCRTPYLFSHAQSLHSTVQTTCVHGSRGFTSSSPNCVPKTIPSSTRHVSFLVALDTEHQHQFSLTYISCVTFVYLSRLQARCPRIQLPTAKIHGRMALLRNTNLSQVMSPRRTSSTGPCSTNQIMKLTTRMILRKLVSNCCPPANH